MIDQLAWIRELADRILLELEEAGEENIPTILNVVNDRHGVHKELEDLQVALVNLVQSGHVRMAVERDRNGLLQDADVDTSLRVISELPDYIRFDSDRGRWTNARIKGPPFPEAFPYAVHTPVGKLAGRQLINERGYRWWRPSKQ
jgi:hypothetical protein